MVIIIHFIITLFIVQVKVIRTIKALWIKDGEVVADDLNGIDAVTVADAVL